MNAKAKLSFVVALFGNDIEGQSASKVFVNPNALVAAPREVLAAFQTPPDAARTRA